MRKELLTNPYLFIDRIGQMGKKMYRKSKIRKYGLSHLKPSHYDHFELLELVRGQVKIIYDIGANKGHWAELANKILMPELIVCFEPMRPFFLELQNKKREIPNLESYNIGLGTQQQSIFMHVAGDSSSILPLTDLQFTHFGVKHSGQQEILIDVLDSFVKQEKLISPDLIKIDVQGYELEVLKGSKEVLKNTKYLLIEISFKEFYENQASAEEIICFLSQCGFRIKALSEMTALSNDLYQTDILFECVT
ncbi:MAG: FkbM family methyltransferase [Flavobacteriia bacterium]|jgi:FkbM family methyltransferase